MNGRLDKIAPGLAAKLNLLFDEAFALLFVLLSAARGGVVLDGRVLILSAVIAGGWFFAAAVLRLYSPCTPRSRADSIVLHLVGATGLSLAVAIAEGLMWDSPPVAPLLFGGSFVVASLLVRLTFLAFQNHLEPALEEVLIVGAGTRGRAAFERLTHGAGEHRSVVGFLRFEDEPEVVEGADAPVLGDADDLLRIVSTTPVSEVYVAAPATRHAAAMQRVVGICEELGLPFALPVQFLDTQRAALLAPEVAPDGFIHYQATRWAPFQCAVKRLIDIAASLLALVCLSPLLVVVAAIIKLTSPGPVLFKQERVGLHGHTFNLFKFRSMVQNAEALRQKLLEKNEQTGPVFKIKHDPRITPIGRFIRKYSIDELPQLINILRGDMTIVGPRPALPSEVAQYRLWQRRRLSVRPGLTCFWQVGGRNTIGFEEWMRLDLQYVDSWSLALDLRLIAMTFPVVLAGRGAS